LGRLVNGDTGSDEDGRGDYNACCEGVIRTMRRGVGAAMRGGRAQA
jgi:hypothetical protein